MNAVAATNSGCMHGHPGPLVKNSQLCKRCYERAQQEWAAPDDLWFCIRAEFAPQLDAAARQSAQRRGIGNQAGTRVVSMLAVRR